MQSKNATVIEIVKDLQRNLADVRQNRCSQKFRKFHRKTPVLEPDFNKVARCQTCSFTKKRLQNRCLPVKFTKFLRTYFLEITSGGFFGSRIMYFENTRNLILNIRVSLYFTKGPIIGIYSVRKHCCVMGIKWVWNCIGTYYSISNFLYFEKGYLSEEQLKIFNNLVFVVRKKTVETQ